MKAFAAIIVLFAASSSFAQSTCKQLDAQIIAHVESINTIENSSFCRAKLSFAGAHDMYNENFQCPLDIDEVTSNGVLMDCDTKAGEQVDGILYRSIDNDSIFLY